MNRSALYTGSVYHERLAPRPHAFRNRLYALYLDLAELPELFDGYALWSARGRNLANYRRSDYLGDPGRDLSECVLERVESELGRRPTGAVRMLTQLRTWGYLFNPVTFYYCFDSLDTGEESLSAIVAEITNTPWGERHAYVLDARAARVGTDPHSALRWSFPKTFHVSPFFPMEQEYLWEFAVPGEELRVRMTNLEGQTPLFRVGLELAKQPITSGSLARALLTHPLQTARIHAAIYWQAARLWTKRTPFFEHPSKRTASSSAETS